MAYRTRSARRISRKSRRNFIFTVLLIVFLLYATISWVLPPFINTLGFITDNFKPSQKEEIRETLENSTLAPPVLSIPYEATNSAKIDIRGYALPKSKVQIFIDDQLKKEVISEDDGSFLAKDIELALGTNNIFGKTADEKNTGSLPSKTIRVIYDSEKPNLEIFEPEDDKKVSGDRKLKISGKTESGARIYINGNQIIVDKDGNFASDQSLNDGDNTFNIRASDSASNFVEISRRVNFTPK